MLQTQTDHLPSSVMSCSVPLVWTKHMLTGYLGVGLPVGRCSGAVLTVQSTSIMVEYTEEDPKPQLEEACKVECVKEWHEYQECAKRIEKSDHEGAHCTGWAFDYWKCIDKCVAPKLFQRLK